MAVPEEIRRSFENPPVFSITIESGELLIHWGNSFLHRYTNSLLDHMTIVEEGHTFLAFPTIGNAAFLDTLEGYGWEVAAPESESTEVIEFAVDQIIKEAMAYPTDL